MADAGSSEQGSTHIGATRAARSGEGGESLRKISCFDFDLLISNYNYHDPRLGVE
jgi:hypothetical protein